MSGERSATVVGGLYALAAYGAWGLSPVFWKLIADVPAVELLAHRVVWAMLLYGALLAWRGRLGELLERLRRPRAQAVFVLTGTLLAVNWVTYIYAVLTDRVLHASLGYFITPLVNLLLGFVFLRERPRRWQWVAVALAAIGVGIQASRVESFPWIALVLAASFGVYGLVRKTADADALLGSNLETLLSTPVALVFLLSMALSGDGSFGSSGTVDLLLIATGPVTALPLLWFSHAARRLRLTTLGFYQYIAPTLQLLLAIWVYDEPFAAWQLRGFLFIWAALALFSIESWWHARRGDPRSASG